VSEAAQVARAVAGLFRTKPIVLINKCLGFRGGAVWAFRAYLAMFARPARRVEGRGTVARLSFVPNLEGAIAYPLCCGDGLSKIRGAGC